MLSYLLKALFPPKKARSRAQKSNWADDALLVFITVLIIGCLS